MGFDIYDNILVGEIPLTPSTPFDKNVLTIDADDSLTEFAFTLGYPVGYAQEQNGRIIQNIIPSKGTEHAQISTSSKSELALHTETAFHPYKPDYVLLLCVRGDLRAETTVAVLSDVMLLLTKDTIRTLMNPWFITNIDDSFRTNGEPNAEVMLPILREYNGEWELTYDASFMRGINNASRNALEEVRSAIDKSIRSVALKAGQLMVINNKTSAHGRRPFTPRYDGTDRWLKRALVVKNLPPVTDYDNGVITTRF